MDRANSQQINKLKHTNININVGYLYARLSSLIINLDSADSLCDYLDFLLKNEDMQVQISAIFDSAARIVTNNAKNENLWRTWMLPPEYIQETWRCHKLIIDIFDKHPRSIESLNEMIKFWKAEDPLYI